MGRLCGKPVKAVERVGRGLGGFSLPMEQTSNVVATSTVVLRPITGVTVGVTIVRKIQLAGDGEAGLLRRAVHL